MNTIYDERLKKRIILLFKLFFKKGYCLYFDDGGKSSYVSSLVEAFHILKTTSCYHVSICDSNNAMEKIGFVEFEVNEAGEMPKILSVGDYNNKGDKVSSLVFELTFFENIEIIDDVDNGVDLCYIGKSDN